MIPLVGGSKDEERTQVYALWRTMLKEIPELGGYPIDFLQEVYDGQLESNDDDDKTKLQATPSLLPYLDDYEFAAAGGIVGNIYGVPGLADGAKIETSAVSNIEVTLPKGFVRTTDGSAAYELGKPRREALSDDSIMTTVAASSSAEALQVAKDGSYQLLKSVSQSVPTSTSLNEADGMLVRLGATTGILLAGATAFQMLSHHLTVNVFWV